MDSVPVNDGRDCIEDAFDEQSLSPELSEGYDVFGEPQVFPRVGDEYQVEIPPLIAGSDDLLLTKNPADAVNTSGSPHDFLMGLAVPIMWIGDEVDNVKHEPQGTVVDSNEVSNKVVSLRSECITESCNILEKGSIECKAEPINSPVDNGTNLGESANPAMQQEMSIELQSMNRGKGYCPVPGSRGDPWNDIEEASFILGLYIFGKNLVQVKKFVGSKKMGHILSFYYGQFYRSGRYNKWSECRKMRSRRCIYGQRIFTGLRQQELFSRLLPHVSQECQNKLLEVSKAFGEGKMLLEEYVFILRASVGVNALVEAVGIGKGKQDLTGIMEPLKSTQVVPVRPEIPIGKACSTLTTLEIVNFLTGDFRLSKGRSNDLFWEAVWPRLLARGWHSEQPTSNGCVFGSKHSLVFLIPGIKKFSRRKLVKGNHYFDSVSDVLSKVASEPGLLELEIGTDDYRSKEENGWADETKLGQGDFPDQQRHCYLKPRTPNHGTDALKFTVVDTSLANGKTIKVRELRSLPSGVRYTSTSGTDSEEEDEDNSEATEKSDSAGNSGFDRDETRAISNNFDPETSFSRACLEDNASNGGFLANGLDSTNLAVNISCEQKASICSDADAKPRKTTKCQVSRRTGPENKNHLPPVAKRRRKLNACGRTEMDRSKFNILRDPSLKQEKASGSAENPDFKENVPSQMDSSREKKPCSSFSKGCPIISDEGIRDAEAFMTEIKETEHDEVNKEPDDPNVVKPSDSVPSPEQLPNINSRRHSTRSRPPTTKALEALAFGYLDPKQKRKSRDTSSQENFRPSRRSRAQVKATENFGSSVVDLKVEERANGVHHSNGDMLTKLQA